MPGNTPEKRSISWLVRTWPLDQPQLALLSGPAGITSPQVAAWRVRSQLGNAIPMYEESPIQLTALAENVVLFEAGDVNWV